MIFSYKRESVEHKRGAGEIVKSAKYADDAIPQWKYEPINYIKNMII